jgi:hypothetical protein
MAEAKEAEPNERAAPPPRRPHRNHVINLCCAQSVQGVVEQVARSLEGLGFRVSVVCGAEARAALLDSRTDSNQPTIHVVCVQGSMQERVLKPLRQALATHGGPNHHLFVAVLDVGVPLAMVGQIRRFAEALERSAPPSPPAAGTTEGREPSRPRDFEQSPTRSYPAVAQVVERGGTKPPVAADGDDSRRARPLSARERVAKISPTSKYQAVTASHPVAAEPGVRKRRRARSRLSPAARRREPNDRVLGLPEHEPHRQASEPHRREQPPPPPAPGELTRRRSAPPTPPAVSSASPPPPPPPRTPSSTALPTMGSDGSAGPEAATTPHRRWPDGKPPALAKPERPEPERPEPERPEPERPVSHRDPSFRFTPPGAKAAEDRPRSGPFTTVPLADVLDGPDKTMVEGVLAEVPRTASTLRLDEPPFQGGSRAKREDANDEPVEPVEPTMIIAAPTGPAATPAVAARPAVTGSTVVGPPPKPSPEVLAELERGRRAADAERKDGRPDAEPDERASGPRKTVSYMRRDDLTEAAPAPSRAPEPAPDERAKTLVSESSRTLARPPSDDDDDVIVSQSSRMLALSTRDEDDVLGSESSRTLVQRPRGQPDRPLSSESSGTLVLRPRPAIDAPPASESSGTLPPRLRLTGDARPSSESSGTRRLRLTSGARPSESSGPLPPHLRPAGDGTPSAGPSGTVVQPTPTGDAPEVSETEKTLLRSDGTFENAHELLQKVEASQRALAQDPAPSDATAAASIKPHKTVLYVDSTSAPIPKPPAADEGGTVVTPVPTPVPTSVAPPASAPEAASQQDTAESRQPAAGLQLEATPPIAQRRPPPSAIPTERHPLAKTEPPRRSRNRRIPPRKPQGAVAALADETADKPQDAKPRPRTKPRPSYGWLWIMLALLTAGASLGTYQAGLLDDLLGRRPAGSTVAKTSEPTPSGAAEVEAGASTGPGDSAPAEAGLERATTTATPALTSADDPSTGTPDAGSTGTPDAGSTGTPDEPAAGSTSGDTKTSGDAPTTGSTSGEPTSPDGPAPHLSPTETMLATAAAERRIFMLKTLFTTRRQGSATTFLGGWQRCAKLEVDGVKGWRLPHRREMKLINAVLPLPSGLYWTRTVPPDDRQAAFVLDTNTGELSLFLKQEPTGEVVCVREREHPDK